MRVETLPEFAAALIGAVLITGLLFYGQSRGWWRL